jgi:hypothetical protein
MAHKHSSFLNVDLDICSRTRLDTLAAAMGDAVMALHSGWLKPAEYLLRLELSREPSGKKVQPDDFITAFCDIIERLSPADRRLWDRATQRSFDIGWDCNGAEAHAALAIKRATIQRMARLGASLAVTFYHESGRQCRRAGVAVP